MAVDSDTLFSREAELLLSVVPLAQIAVLLMDEPAEAVRRVMVADPSVAQRMASAAEELSHLHAVTMTAALRMERADV